MEIDSKPEELDRLDRRLIQLKIEREAVRKDEDQSARQRLEKIEAEIAELEREYAGLDEIWKAEKATVQGSHQIKSELEQARLEHGERAPRGRPDAHGGTAVRHHPGAGEAPRGRGCSWRSGDHKMQLLRDKVGEEEIAEVVSKWTGIPVSQDARGRAREAAAHGGARCTGAWSGRTRRSRAVRRGRRNRAGLPDPNAAARLLPLRRPHRRRQDGAVQGAGGGPVRPPDALMRIDMSEFMEKHSVSRLIGSPPGYVGYDEGGHLTEAVRRRPYSLLLLDEVEKAHPDVFNVLLQVLEDGRLTDGHGRTVDFRNTVVVMTSNLGSDLIQEMATEADYPRMKAAVMEVVDATSAPSSSTASMTRWCSTRSVPSRSTASRRCSSSCCAVAWASATWGWMSRRRPSTCWRCAPDSTRSTGAAAQARDPAPHRESAGAADPLGRLRRRGARWWWMRAASSALTFRRGVGRHSCRPTALRVPRRP